MSNEITIVEVKYPGEEYLPGSSHEVDSNGDESQEEGATHEVDDCEGMIVIDRDTAYTSYYYNEMGYFRSELYEERKIN